MGQLVMHSVYTIVFLGGVVTGALVLGAWILIANELDVYRQSRRPTGETIDLTHESKGT